MWGEAGSLGAGGIMAGWFKRAAGWQRLWLLGSLAAWALCIWALPARFETSAFAQLAEARARVVADFDKPECMPVRSTPYPQLAPVPAGAPCHEMYVWRKDVREKLPLILEHVTFAMDSHRREIWVTGAVKATGVAALLSVLLYALFFLMMRPRAEQQ